MDCMNETKYCRKCNKYLECKKFHRTKHKSYIDGRINICKDCIKNKEVVVKHKPVFKVIDGEYIVCFE
jgi:hypothetical protein